MRDARALRQVAVAVAEDAFKEGVAGIEKPADLEGFLRDRMWSPSKQRDLEQQPHPTS